MDDWDDPDWSPESLLGRMVSGRSRWAMDVLLMAEQREVIREAERILADAG